jgi:hypothetical protein
MTVATKPLTGNALLNKLKEIPNLSKSEKAKVCGYISVTKRGTEKTDMAAFVEAVLDAEGLSLTHGEKIGRGRVASYRGRIYWLGEYKCH